MSKVLYPGKCLPSPEQANAALPLEPFGSYFLRKLHVNISAHYFYLSLDHEDYRAADALSYGIWLRFDDPTKPVSGNARKVFETRFKICEISEIDGTPYTFQKFTAISDTDEDLRRMYQECRDFLKTYGFEKRLNESVFAKYR